MRNPGLRVASNGTSAVGPVSAGRDFYIANGVSPAYNVVRWEAELMGQIMIVITQADGTVTRVHVAVPDNGRISLDVWSWQGEQRYWVTAVTGSIEAIPPTHPVMASAS